MAKKDMTTSQFQQVREPLRTSRAQAAAEAQGARSV